MKTDNKNMQNSNKKSSKKKEDKAKESGPSPSRKKASKQQDSQAGAVGQEDAHETAIANEHRMVAGALGLAEENSAASDSKKQLVHCIVREVTEAEEFQNLLLSSSGEKDNEKKKKKKKDDKTNLVMACFGAAWCRPCIVFAPRLELLARRFNQVVFVKINVDKIPEIADQYSVKAVPTFVLFNKGSKAGVVVSANQAKIEELLISNGAIPTEPAEQTEPTEPDDENKKPKLNDAKLKSD